MDANRGAIFAFYTRALCKDLSLSRKVNIQMLLQPSGAITSISSVSSKFSDQALVKNILSRVKPMNFGAEPVEQPYVNYSLFLLGIKLYLFSINRPAIV